MKVTRTMSNQTMELTLVEDVPERRHTRDGSNPNGDTLAMEVTRTETHLRRKLPGRRRTRNRSNPDAMTRLVIFQVLLMYPIQYYIHR